MVRPHGGNPWKSTLCMSCTFSRHTVLGASCRSSSQHNCRLPQLRLREPSLSQPLVGCLGRIGRLCPGTSEVNSAYARVERKLRLCRVPPPEGSVPQIKEALTDSAERRSRSTWLLVVARCSDLAEGPRGSSSNSGTKPVPAPDPWRSTFSLP